MLAGVPRERRRATRAVDEWTRVERGAYWSIGPFTTLNVVTTVRSDSPRAPPRVIAPPTHRWNAASRQPAAEELQWTRNAFFSLEKASHGPYTIPKDYAACMGPRHPTTN